MKNEKWIIIIIFQVCNGQNAKFLLTCLFVSVFLLLPIFLCEFFYRMAIEVEWS